MFNELNEINKILLPDTCFVDPTICGASLLVTEASGKTRFFVFFNVQSRQQHSADWFRVQGTLIDIILIVHTSYRVLSWYVYCLFLLFSIWMFSLHWVFVRITYNTIYSTSVSLSISLSGWAAQLNNILVLTSSLRWDAKYFGNKIWNEILKYFD